MSRFALLLLLAACGDAVIEQDLCEASLSPGTSVVRDSEVINSASGGVLVCGSGEAILNGAGGRVFVTSGGEVIVNASGAEVWLLNGATATLNASSSDVYREASASVQGNLSPGTTTVCGTIDLDLSELESGC